MNTKLKLFIITLSYVGITNSAQAAYERHFSPLQCIPQRVATIAGSNGDNKLIEIQQNMATTSLKLQESITTGFTDMMTTQSQSTNAMISNTLKNAKMSTEQEFELKKAQQKLDIAFEAEKEARRIQRNRSIISTDDTPEEMDIIIKALVDQGPDTTVLFVSEILTKKYDDTKLKIPVKINRADGVCTPKQVEKGECATFKSITPGAKLRSFFQACNEAKKVIESKKRTERAQQAASQVSAKKVNAAISNTNSSTAIANKMNEQKERNCTVEGKLNGYCGTDFSLEEMQEQYRKCVINENGNISSGNLTNPPSVCGLARSPVDKQTFDTLSHDALDNTALENNPEQNKDVVPIVYSYKNINQIKSAYDFAENIIATELISNQNAKDRNKTESLEYQSRYNSRLARLSLAHSSILDSIKIRTGKILSTYILENPDFMLNNTSDPIKESILGGGELDVLNSEIDDSYKKVQLLNSGDSGSIQQAALHGQSVNNYWEKELLNQIALQNKILFKQYFQKESEKLMKAAQLASEVNSPNNILYMQELRRGK